MLVLSITAFLSVGFAMTASAGHEDPTEAPTIDALDPGSGAPGTFVYIEGEGFSEDDQVTFGGYTVTFEYFDETRLGFEVPEGPLGEYQVGVENAAGTDTYCCFEINEENNTADNDTGRSPGPGDQDVGSDVDEEECNEPRMNVECNAFGIIKMPSQEHIEGERIRIDVLVNLETNYVDQDARTILFSIRNVTDFEESPVTITLESFSSPDGEIFTERVEQNSPNELNIWVNTLDVPVGKDLTISVEVGVTERGAYNLETLVMPFDRGYEPMKDRSGEDVSLYSYTLLGVRDETGGLDSDGAIGSLKKTPAPGIVFALAAIGIAAAGIRRRSG